MVESAAFAVCAILASLTVFQFLLLFGAPLGRYTQGGSQVVLSAGSRVICAISIVLYVGFALIVLSKAGLVSAFDGVSGVGIWVLTAYAFIGIFMNAISRSKKERAVMTPTALILGLLCLFVAMN